MSLIPLAVYDNLRSLCCSLRAGCSTADHHCLAECIIRDASIFDLLRWRRVSRSFRKAAEARLSHYTQIHVRVYDGLAKLHAKRSQDSNEEMCWHPSACLLICETKQHTLGVAVDAKLNWKDVLIQLLSAFRNTAETICMDSPVIELLVAEVNNQKVSALLSVLQKTRKTTASFTGLEQRCVAALNEPRGPDGPFFPRLRQFTVTSNPTQLGHLSRLLHYSVAVDLIYQKEDIDLVCLQVILGESWCRSKQRMFRHVNRFKEWSEASELGVRYVQQFHGETPRRRRSKF